MSPGDRLYITNKENTIYNYVYVGIFAGLLLMVVLFVVGYSDGGWWFGKELIRVYMWSVTDIRCSLWCVIHLIYVDKIKKKFDL